MHFCMWMALQMSPTCFQTAPVNLFEEGLILELCAVIIFEPQTFCWVLLHQALTDILAIFAKGRCI